MTGAGEDSKESVGVGWGQTKLEVGGGEAGGDGNWGRSWGWVELEQLQRSSNFEDDAWCFGCAGVGCCGGAKLDLGVDGRGTWERRGWALDLGMGVAGDRFPTIAMVAFVGLVGKEFLKEILFGGWVILFLADGLCTAGALGTLDAAAKTASKGMGKLALALGVGVGVNGKVGVGCASLKGGFCRAEEGSQVWGRVPRGFGDGWAGCGCGSQVGRCRWEAFGNAGRDLGAAHCADLGLFIMDLLCCCAELAELIKLGGEGGQSRVVAELVGRASFVQALLDFGGQAGEELLDEGAGPGGNGSSRGGVKGGASDTKDCSMLVGEWKVFLHVFESNWEVVMVHRV